MIRQGRGRSNAWSLAFFILESPLEQPLNSGPSSLHWPGSPRAVWLLGPLLAPGMGFLAQMVGEECDSTSEAWGALGEDAMSGGFSAFW